ncbi:MAG: hypothetical protein J6S18_04015, partial [Oscillospiraceae bacterium]|nr:hypothetical protein [Oscillospiraceae bacterium]
MAKKSTRVLSFILSALLLVTMLPVVSLAEEAKYYTFDEAAATKPYYDKLDFTALVGPANEELTNVFVINKAWKYKQGQEPENVKFVFRGETVTETYNASRHMSLLAEVQKYITDNGIKNPVIILTEGVYAETFKIANGFTILGPKAGMNPNVPDADPTKEWALSSNRRIPTESNTYGEAVFRVEGGLAGDHVISGASNSVGTQNYIVDGVVFQGNGSGVADESDTGSGTRNWYVQNCIFDDCHSIEGRGNYSGLAFDRRSSQTYYKNLYVSNSYITNQNTKALYSGHATSINFNGISMQNSRYPIAYNIGCMQWQGQTTVVTNSHFWNAKGATRENGKTAGIYFNLNWSNYCNSGSGTDDAPFIGTFRNNSFYHMNTADAPLFQVSVAGNTKVAIEENIFISEENKAARPAVDIKYLTVDGKVTHEGIGNFSSGAVDGEESAVGNYKLTNEQVMIRNNTFVGSEFQALPSIGTNLHDETALELLGNLYLDNMGSKDGKVIDPYVE